MSAETLRRAAALMRERAEAARAGRWGRTESTLAPDGMLVVANWAGGPVRVATCTGSLPEGNQANAEHIASWHPAVALAAADALALYAELIDEDSAIPMDHKMLAFARAYLGESTTPLPPHTPPTTCGECGDPLAGGQRGYHPDCYRIRDGA